jgi:SPP1 family predicted phage head-tail adaptor
MATTRAGDLRQRVLVQTKNITGTGDRGQPVYAWETRLKAPAYVEPLQGRKLEIARQLVPTATHEVHLRYCQLGPQERLVLDGSRVLNIGYVTNKLENEFMHQALCTEVQNASQ